MGQFGNSGYRQDEPLDDFANETKYHEPFSQFDDPTSAFGSTDDAFSDFDDIGNNGGADADFDDDAILGKGGFPSGLTTSTNAGLAGGVSVVEAPVPYLLPSLILSIVSLAICLWVIFRPVYVTEGIYLPVVGVSWITSGLLSISLLSLYFIKNTKRKAEGVYIYKTWKTLFYWFTILLIITAVIVSAVQLGLWVGKI
ncbi:hypothetical protein [uncultured Corynebacterium sp.]|uniref:hypothetical protein n=1 Tax=uncultured Corynebacterium sp. TaxID=159447 RepID=UPI0025FEE6C0|nr:hypothetical protein [uncultured Corynebacterium sp.]